MYKDKNVIVFTLLTWKMVFCSRLLKRYMLTLALTALIIAMLMMYYMQRPRSTVVVVDDHLDALPYWIKGYEAGQLPPNDVMLIHFDSRADDALPEIFPGMDVFSRPLNDMHMQMLLQNNDVVVEEAVIMGLVDRVIWVQPPWLAGRKSNASELHEKHQMHIGITKFPYEDETVRKTVLCQCTYSAENKRRVCTYRARHPHKASSDPHEAVILSDFRQCRPMRTYTLDITTAKSLAHTLRHKNDIADYEGRIILDIDESYFGLKSPWDYLLQAEVSLEFVAKLDDVLGRLCCPDAIEDEGKTDQVLTEIMEYVLLLKKAENTVIGLSPSGHVKAQQFISQQKKIYPEVFCDLDDTKQKNINSDLVSLLIASSSDKLKTFIKVGFCLNISPSVVTFKDDGRMVLCHGSHYPPTDRTNLKSVMLGDVNDQYLEGIKQALHLLPTPSVVSVARSVRAGATSKHNFKPVEEKLLDIIRELYSPTRFVYSYDKNLAGGVHGMD